MAQYWLRHAEQAWLPGTLTVTTGPDGQLGFVVDNGRPDGEVIILPKGSLETLKSVHSQELEGVDDLSSLTSVSEAALLHSIRVRYQRDEVYTRIMRTLVALNPFTDLPIYDSQHVDRYMAASDSLNVPPHIFGIGRDAIRALQAGGRDQAILISGESGAGKTESAKLILSFVAEAVRAKGGAAGMEDAVLQTNPVLEAFGNAMTVRNNNSSRFGKWLDLRISSRSLELLGCTLTSYLLETTRVCSQAWDERGYHIFFQLLQARREHQFSTWGLQDAKHYRYLKDGQLTVPGVDDEADFRRLREALTVVGVDSAEQIEVFKVLAAILSLGNCDFKPLSEGCGIVDESFAGHAADFLGVSCEALTHCLLFRTFVAGRNVTETPLRLEQAPAARDGLARLLYGRLFLWLIGKMNSKLMAGSSEQSPVEENSLCHGTEVRDKLLGVLDIAGFENFNQNSLEQLMINLSNEHLQLHYNRVAISEERDDLIREGFEPPDLGGFSDNLDCLALIDGKGGILDLLDDTMTVPKATDMTFVSKVLGVHAQHQRLIPGKVARCGFGVRHFAGDVTYSSDGWLEKNSDRPPDDFAKVLAVSQLRIVSEIGAAVVSETGSGAANAGGARKANVGAARKAKSVTSGFRASLRALMEKVALAEPHYVRCVKPNMEKRPQRFDGNVVLEQLLLSGVLATVKIRQQGFAYRYLHHEFLHKYRPVVERLAPGRLPKRSGPGIDRKEEAETVVHLLAQLQLGEHDGDAEEVQSPFAPGNVVVGHTRVFLKVVAFNRLDRAYRVALFNVALLVSRFVRGFLARRRARVIAEILEGLRAVLNRLGVLDVNSSRRPSLRGHLLLGRLDGPEDARALCREIEIHLVRARAFNLEHSLRTNAEQAITRLGQELVAWDDVVETRSSTDPVAIEKALARARSLELTTLDGPFKELEKRLSRLKTQLPLLRAVQDAITNWNAVKREAASRENDEGDALAEVRAILEEVGLGQGSKGWLPELNSDEVVSELYSLIDLRDKALAEAAKRAQAVASVEVATANTSVTAGIGTENATADATEKFVHDPPQRRRSVKRTITLSNSGSISQIRCEDPHEQEETLRGLQKATEEYDVAKLEQLLRRVTLESIAEEEPTELISSRKMFEQLQDEDFLIDRFTAVRVELEGEDPSMLSLRRLDNLTRQFESIPGLEKQVVQGRQVLQQGLVRRAGGQSIFQSKDREELELAGRVFSRLTNYSKVKPATTWKGHRRSIVGGLSSPQIERAPANKMLTHSKICIAEALTYAPQSDLDGSYDAAAVQNFRNVLMCMGDRPAQETQRHASRLAVIELAASNPSMRDEVFAQVLKQITENPSQQSVELGWDLLCALCQQAPPSAEMIEFCRAYIRNADGCHEVHAKGKAQACLAAMDRAMPLQERSTKRGSTKPERRHLGIRRSGIEHAGFRSRFSTFGSRLSACVFPLEEPDTMQEVHGASAENTKLLAENMKLKANLERNIAEIKRLTEQTENQAAELLRLRAELAAAKTGLGSPAARQAEADIASKPSHIVQEGDQDVKNIANDSGDGKGKGKAKGQPFIGKDAKTTSSSAPVAAGDGVDTPATAAEPPSAVGKGKKASGPSVPPASPAKGKGPAPAGGKPKGATPSWKDKKVDAQSKETAPVAVLSELSVELSKNLEPARPRLFPKKGDRVAIHYKARKLASGEEIDTSFDGDPFEFTVGAGEAIRGWDDGIPQVPLGAEAILKVPAALAYGKEDLSFEVKLLSINGSTTSSVSSSSTAKVDGAKDFGVDASDKDYSGRDEVNLSEFPSFAETLALRLSRGCDVARQEVFTFLERQSKSREIVKASKSAFPPFEVRRQGEVQYINIQISVRKTGDSFQLTYTSSCSCEARPTDSNGFASNRINSAFPPKIETGVASQGQEQTSPATVGSRDLTAPPSFGAMVSTPPVVTPSPGPRSNAPVTPRNTMDLTREASAEKKKNMLATPWNATSGQAGRSVSPIPGSRGTLTPPGGLGHNMIGGASGPKESDKSVGPASPRPGTPQRNTREASVPRGALTPRGFGRTATQPAEPLNVVAGGAGGIEELRNFLDDSTVTWSLMRFQVGGGSFSRTKFVLVHFNGEDVPTVKRGRLNARTREAIELLGDTHATVEVKRKEEVAVDLICERVLPVFISDSSEKASSASALKKEYESMIAKAKTNLLRSRAISQVNRTAKERSKGGATTRDVLRAVAATKGCYNWVLMEPDGLELHNGGYGGLDEMKTWLDEAKVLFGVIRFTFGVATVRYVFIHWVGGAVGAVKRGRWNAKIGEAEAYCRNMCILTVRQEVHSLDDLKLEEIVREIRRISIVDGLAGSEEAAITVEEYMENLEKERLEMLMTEDTGDAEPGLMDMQKAVEAVRSGGEGDGNWNWMMLGVGTPMIATGA